MIQRRTFVCTATSALAGLALPALSQSATMENARFITGFAAGGTSDTLCRRLAARMTGSYAKTVVVENRTGAGGQIAVQAIKGMPADGSAILQTPMSMLGVYPHIYKKLPYDPLKDVTPVSLGCEFDFGFAVGPSVPASVTTVPQFLDWAKQNPNGAAFGSPAAGSVPHFVGVLLGKSAGVELRHAAYRGSQPAVADMLGGHVPAVSGPVGEFLPHLPTGKCRLLGTTGAARSRFARTVPTMTEQGFKDMVVTEWFGLFLPANAPADVVDRLNAALRPALAAPEVVEGLATMGMEATASTPAQLAARLKADHDYWGPIVKSIGFTADS
jgi:tripartite-type tricarboxylate transporter receptor subunit TctC